MLFHQNKTQLRKVIKILVFEYDFKQMEEILVLHETSEKTAPLWEIDEKTVGIIKEKGSYIQEKKDGDI